MLDDRSVFKSVRLRSLLVRFILFRNLLCQNSYLFWCDLFCLGICSTSILLRFILFWNLFDEHSVAIYSVWESVRRAFCCDLFCLGICSTSILLRFILFCNLFVEHSASFYSVLSIFHKLTKQNKFEIALNLLFQT